MNRSKPRRATTGSHAAGSPSSPPAAHQDAANVCHLNTEGPQPPEVRPVTIRPTSADPRRCKSAVPGAVPQTWDLTFPGRAPRHDAVPGAGRRSRLPLSPITTQSLHPDAAARCVASVSGDAVVLCFHIPPRLLQNAHPCPLLLVRRGRRCPGAPRLPWATPQ